MWIRQIKINNFRNCEEEEIKLDQNINIFYGENAQGKTNIIETCFLASFGKSFRANKDTEMIQFGKEQLNLEVDFQKSDREGNIKINIDKKKNIFVNKIKIKKLSDLLGNINIVIFTPDDINILKGGPENRRKFLNIMISQLRPKYMYVYNLYLKTMEERNNYLKKIKLENIDENLLDIWDDQLIKYAKNIAIYRNEFIEKIKSRIETIHYAISENREKIKLEYVTECLDEKKYRELLKQRRKLDIMKGYTTKGIHRDDFFIFLNDCLVTTFGSQGQRRSVMLSLKMAELKVINDEIGENPILLLDDFMSELDEKRRNNFLKNIDGTQIIITCTDKLLLNNLNGKFFKVENGCCKEECSK